MLDHARHILDSYLEATAKRHTPERYAILEAIYQLEGHFTVEELNGCPGVLSARWSGQHGDDQANNILLLKQMAHVPEERRQAAFVSVCALVVPNGEEHVVTGQWDGWMLTEPRGDNGFGYDPLFLPNEEFPNGRSSAQLSPAEKNALSHRGKALAQLVPIVTQLSQLSEANSD